MSRQRKTIHFDTNPFICEHCGLTVPSPLSGTKNRNHCCHCLHSKHVDMKIGDRRSGCRGTMEPIALWVKDNGECAVIHQCQKCGFIRTNRIACDDNEVVLFTLAARLITQLPFPARVALDKIERQHMGGEHV
ncbi:RNHCP domain-containing protein [Desulfobaculum sp. SPO524]|uniref:RNHCP domain-containing protein n=1 Tax=Desulfobaculum sp. SPO524 TaxID=3378071 RepID=UPI00385202F0